MLGLVETDTENGVPLCLGMKMVGNISSMRKRLMISRNFSIFLNLLTIQLQLQYGTEKLNIQILYTYLSDRYAPSCLNHLSYLDSR